MGAVADPAKSRQKISDEAHRITKGKVMPQPRGVITSPNYPSNYPNLMSYWWSATTSGGLVWRVTFTDFETEQGYDVVRIYDGPSASSPLLLTASGSGLPSTVYTTQSDLYITLDSYLLTIRTIMETLTLLVIKQVLRVEIVTPLGSPTLTQKPVTIL